MLCKAIKQQLRWACKGREGEKEKRVEGFTAQTQDTRTNTPTRSRRNERVSDEKQGQKDTVNPRKPERMKKTEQQKQSNKTRVCVREGVISDELMKFSLRHKLTSPDETQVTTSPDQTQVSRTQHITSQRQTAVCSIMKRGNVRHRPDQ